MTWPTMSRFKRTAAADGLSRDARAGRGRPAASLPDELRTLYEADDADDPVHDRLFPTRVPRSDAGGGRATSGRRWCTPSCCASGSTALEVIAASLDRGVERRDKLRVELAEDEASAWLGVLNDARLALGARLDVTEETDFSRIRP